MQSITNELSKEDMLALENISTEEAQYVKKYLPNDNTDVEEWNKILPHFYNSLYDMTIYSNMENNAILLKYFEKLKDDDKKKQLYDSLNKVYFKYIHT